MQHGGGLNGGVSGEHPLLVRRVPRYHSSPRLQRVRDDGFQGAGTTGVGQQQQQQQTQHHHLHSHSISSTRQQHYHQQQQQQQQQRQRQQQRQQQQYRVDLHGVVPVQQQGYGNGGSIGGNGGGGVVTRSIPPPPPLMTSHSESEASRTRKGGDRGVGGLEFPHIFGSVEHSNIGLKAHAAEFVPGKGGGAGGGGRAGVVQRSGKQGPQTASGGKRGTLTATKSAPAGSDLTAFAREFIPGGVAGGNDANNISGRGHDSAAVVAGENMVQVVRGGTIFFVPEQEALATDELVGAGAYGPEDDGFAWAQGSAALAAPQRRTMHR